jgi:uncharacterized protein YbjT (DUF2867 family)
VIFWVAQPLGVSDGLVGEVCDAALNGLGAGETHGLLVAGLAEQARRRRAGARLCTIDRALFGYFGIKLATERVVEQSGTGWTTPRATQFHDLILTVAKTLARLPVIAAPGRHPIPAGRRH